jgi:hypothetical protein
VEGIQDKLISVAVQEKGWTDNELALEWLKHFDKHTKGRTIGKKRLLLMDGHRSYQTRQFVSYCQANDILPFRLPPYTTNYLQPLDLTVFGPLAQAYKKEIRKACFRGAVRVSNNQFLQALIKAWVGIVRWIPGAWRAAGLTPWNPDKVLDVIKQRAVEQVDGVEVLQQLLNMLEEVQNPDKLSVIQLMQQLALGLASPQKRLLIQIQVNYDMTVARLNIHAVI